MVDSIQAKARIQIDTDVGRDVFLATGTIGQETIPAPNVYNLTVTSKTPAFTPSSYSARRLAPN